MRRPNTARAAACVGQAGAAGSWTRVRSAALRCAALRGDMSGEGGGAPALSAAELNDQVQRLKIQGKTALARHDFRKARDALTAAIELSPMSYKLHRLRSVAYACLQVSAPLLQLHSAVGRQAQRAVSTCLRAGRRAALRAACPKQQGLGL